MDTLVSVGVTAAYLWSLGALFFTDAVAPECECSFTLVQGHDNGRAHLYLEVAAAVTTFILAGRYFEARAKTNSGAALRALLDLVPRRTHPSTSWGGPIAEYVRESRAAHRVQPVVGVRAEGPQLFP